MEPGTYDAARLRITGLIAMGCVAIAIAQTPLAPMSTLVYLLMIPIGRYSRHLETKARAAAAASGPAPAPTPPAHP